MSTVEERLDNVERELKWIKTWVEFLVMQFYKVDSLDEVPALHQQLKKMPKLEEPPAWVA